MVKPINIISLSPTVFGEKHLSALVFIITLIVIFFLFFKMKLSYFKKNQQYLLHTLTFSFLVIECLRLVFMSIRGYGLSIIQLPLNLCSIPLFAYPILSLFSHNSNVKKWVLPAAFSTTMLAGIIALAIPTNILGNELLWYPISENLVELASFSYHALMILAPLSLLIAGFYTPRLKDIIYAYGFTGLFAAIAITFNHFYNTDFLLLKYGNGSPFQFLINDSLLLYQFVMIGLGMVLISLFFIISEIVYHRQHKFA